MIEESKLPKYVKDFVVEYGDTPDADRSAFHRKKMATNEYGNAFQEMMDTLGAELSGERQELYRDIESRIGNTPLRELKGVLDNGNRLFVKEEFRNGVGASHYDRVYAALYKEKERLGIIKPGDNVFETTSGTAGVSFGAIGEALGYHTHVAIPAGGEKAREDAIREAGSNIYYTPEEEYVNGFTAFIIDFMKKNPNYVFLNHSMGNILGRGSDVNEMAIRAMYQIADEIADELSRSGVSFDNVLSALGNGTNTLGIGKRIAEREDVHTRLIAYETLTSGVGFSQKYGEDVYRQLLDATGRFGAENFGRHSMPGTSYPGIDFPALRNSIQYTGSVVLVADSRVARRYQEVTGHEQLPEGVVQVERIGDDEYGRTTLAGISIAKKLSEGREGETFVAIGYDTASRYDSKNV